MKAQNALYVKFFTRNYAIAHGILKSMFSQSGVEIGWNRVYWWCVLSYYNINRHQYWDFYTSRSRWVFGIYL